MIKMFCDVCEREGGEHAIKRFLKNNKDVDAPQLEVLVNVKKGAMNCDICLDCAIDIVKRLDLRPAPPKAPTLPREISDEIAASIWRETARGYIPPFKFVQAVWTAAFDRLVNKPDLKPGGLNIHHDEAEAVLSFARVSDDVQGEVVAPLEPTPGMAIAGGRVVAEERLTPFSANAIAGRVYKAMVRVIAKA